MSANARVPRPGRRARADACRSASVRRIAIKSVEIACLPARSPARYSPAYLPRLFARLPVRMEIGQVRKEARARRETTEAKKVYIRSRQRRFSLTPPRAPGVPLEALKQPPRDID
jgi:hypothetical protein